MNSKHLVSVIIPTFNRYKFLLKAISSVEAQTYSKFEIIIIDDCSTDETSDYLKTTPYTVITLKQKMGVSYARNEGIKIAKGKYISFLDSDDIWLPNKLESQVTLMSETDYRWCHGEEIWIRNGVRVNQMKKHKKGGGDQFIPSLSLCLISPSTVMLEASLLTEVGGFNEDYLVCEDYDLWLRILLNHSIGFVEEPIIEKYGGHSDQLSRKFFAMDEYRVKTLRSLLKKSSLTSVRRDSVEAIFKKKCEILMKGFLKHKNEKKYQEIFELQKNLSQKD